MRRFVAVAAGLVGVGLIIVVALLRGGPGDSDDPAGVHDTSTTIAASTTASLPTRSSPPSTVSSVASSYQPHPPIRAAFFYPWFPSAWSQQGITPYTNFTPSLGQYDSTDPAVFDQQVAQAAVAGIDAFIASWWGPGHHTDEAFGVLLKRTSEAMSPESSLKWAVYYEREGQGDPAVDELVADLDYLSSRYFASPGYLRVDGRPVVFVWAGSDGSDMARRWAEAKDLFGGDLYVVLKVFSGYRDEPNQPDSWHQYGPAVGYSDQFPYSVTVSPGFFKVGETPRLERDPGRFARDVQRMVDSGAFWHLITSWNEWGEGTAIEPAAEWNDAYLEILAASSEVTVSTTTRPDQTTTSTLDAAGNTVVFAAGGDIGATKETTATLEMVRRRNPDFFLALGDLSYNDVKPESVWCDYMIANLGSEIPIELVVGNHEDDDRKDGWIGAFADCLPDRLMSTGNYPAEYYFDVGGLVRIITIGAGNSVGGLDYDYTAGSERMAWLEGAIVGARVRSIPWVVVAMHKNCLTVGEKDCEIGQDLLDVLTERRVDLVLQGHDHTYQRSAQLTCGIAGRFESGCVADDGSDGTYQHGQGTVFVISGAMGGGNLYATGERDPEVGYMAAWMGKGDPGEGRGFVLFTVTRDRLSGEFIGSTTDYRDVFTITR